MSETKVTQKIIDDAAALKELIATDTEAAMEEMKKAETKSALHHLLNTDPDFRPKGYANATHFGLTDGTGVWVLENPSDETYRALRELQQAEPSMPENQKLEKVGATYYSHCKHHLMQCCLFEFKAYHEVKG